MEVKERKISVRKYIPCQFREVGGRREVLIFDPLSHWQGWVDARWWENLPPAEAITKEEVKIMDLVKAIDEITLITYATIKEFNASAIADVDIELDDTPLIQIRYFRFNYPVENEDEQCELLSKTIIERLRKAGYPKVLMAFIGAPNENKASSKA
jgi:hypothetical protein